jgi:hypothetical protein
VSSTPRTLASAPRSAPAHDRRTRGPRQRGPALSASSYRECQQQAPSPLRVLDQVFEVGDVGETVAAPVLHEPIVIRPEYVVLRCANTFARLRPTPSVPVGRHWIRDQGPAKRDKRFSLRIPSGVLTRMQKAAQADRRSAADWVLLLIERELDALDRRRRRRSRRRCAMCAITVSVTGAPSATSTVVSEPVGRRSVRARATCSAGSATAVGSACMPRIPAVQSRRHHRGLDDRPSARVSGCRTRRDR